ncbi:ribosomal RNA large subunit methyltransferase E [Spirochaetia bacterium]|nr:ribosomal RNA large subunit methyltransferase E [Spirochaetia bacterium]
MAQYDKLDHWSLKAQKEGYPARSVYKLKELDEKFGLLPRSGWGRTGQDRAPFKILDLGAAPGSWSLYLLRKMSGQGSLTAADLSPLSRQYDKGLFDGANFHFIQGDITDGTVRDAILAHGPFNLIISDAAPSTTGNRSVDTLRSLALVEEVIAYTEAALTSGGSLAVKVFQGGDTAAILARIRGLFRTGKSFKPEACRAESFETYYVGVGRK